MAVLVTNLDIYMFLRNIGDMKNWDSIYQAIVNRIPSDTCAEDLKMIKSFAMSYCSNLHRRWISAGRNQKTFLTRYTEWLQNNIIWPSCTSVNLEEIFQDQDENVEDINLQEDTHFQEQEVASTSNVRTSTSTCVRKPFSELGNKQKKRRSGSLLEYSTEELAFALVTKLRSDERLDTARVIDHILSNPESVAVIKTTLFGKDKKDSIDNDHALALYTSLNLSKWKYICLRQVLSDYAAPVLPSYYKLLQAKERCYPSDIEISESGARIKLQSLLDLTVQRILELAKKKCDSSSEGLKLISKWGFDGASSQSTYKQRSEDINFDDSSIFMASLVPLKLVMSNDIIIWENPKPSSTHYCRPIMFEFQKETADFIKKEEARFEEDINNLTTTKCDGLEISHELHMTMIDGKVASIITDTSAASVCNICLAKPSEMNNLSQIYSRPVREDIYKYGLSSLHMWIRCMECVLHISYNMDFQMWSARGPNKELKAAKKQLTQDEFKHQMGILVDFVKQGYGTSNDGNTARRFFSNFEKSAEITKVDKGLLKRFAVILQTISSGNTVNIDKFRSYCRETADLFVHLYPWFYMPASVHKLLIHGADICQYFGVLPIGILSEEAGESRNKDFRNVRENHTRKVNRIKTNEDILHNFLISSDPYISQIRPKYTQHHNKLNLFPEAEELIIMSDYPTEEIEITVQEANQTETDPLL